MITITGLEVFLHELIRDLAAFLGGEMPAVGVTSAYPSRWRDTPLTQPVIAVGLLAAKGVAGPAFLGAKETEGGLPSSDLYGRMTEVAVGFDICCPVETNHCHQLFARLCDWLLGMGERAPSGGVQCGAMAYDSKVGGFVLKARADYDLLVVAPEGAGNLPISDFDLRCVLD